MLVQIMGIIHYLLIAGQEDENAYLPVAHKTAVSHPVTIYFTAATNIFVKLII